MNIVFIESAQNFGGARKAVISMAEILKDTHNVSIVDIYGNCKPFVQACKNSSISFSILREGENPHFIRSASNLIQKIKNLIGFIPNLINVAKSIDDYVKNNNINWICLSGFRPLMCFLFRRTTAKVAFFAHGWYLKNDLTAIQRFLLNKYATKIVCISQATKQSLFNQNITSLSNLPVVHNSIDIDKISQIHPEPIKNSTKGAVIMIAGGFVRGKGHHIAVDIAHELRRRGYEFKLILAGIIYQGRESQQYFDGIIKQIESKNLSQYIEVVVNKHDVLGLMQSCDVIIHPSETEGFPLAVLEAMAMGKVVIANAVGGITDMIIDHYTGILVEHNNVQQFADAIISVTEDPQFYERISQNAVDVARHSFSSSQIAKELSCVFK